MTCPHPNHWIGGVEAYLNARGLNDWLGGYCWRWKGSDLMVTRKYEDRCKKRRDVGLFCRRNVVINVTGWNGRRWDCRLLHSWVPHSTVCCPALKQSLQVSSSYSLAFRVAVYSLISLEFSRITILYSCHNGWPTRPSTKGNLSLLTIPAWWLMLSCSKPGR